jgi:levansucrase
MILSAPKLPDPVDRHALARIRLAMQRGGEWRDCGNLFPDGFCPGKREWAGSAIFDPAAQAVTVFWTAAGRRSDDFVGFEQRIFQSTGQLQIGNGTAAITAWSAPIQSFVSDDDEYSMANQRVGAPGQIDGFRDPAYFQDPADGRHYLLFTGSLKKSAHTHNAVIGIARSNVSAAGPWTLLPPIISADGVNNELERPQILFRDGLYYAFWSTQSSVFAPGGPAGPNGLYGMVASSICGAYRPLNGTGLVAANPAAEPYQSFSWLVMDDLRVASFVDYWGMGGTAIAAHPERIRSHFGGVPAPQFQIKLNGDRTELAQIA